MADAAQDQGDTPENETSLSLLASEYYGQNYKGEVTQPKQTKETTEETEETEETAEETGEAEETAEETTEESSEDDESGEVEYQEYELPQVAQLLGVEENQLDVDDDGKIVLQGKVDGEAVKTPVKELLASYQMSKAADKRLEEAKEWTKSQKQELSQKREEVEAQYSTAAKLIEKAEGLLDQDSKSIDWKALREDDPAEYSAKKQELAERRQEIERMKSEARQEYSQLTEQQKAEQQENLKQYIQQEQQALLEKVPEWKDPDTAKAEDSKLCEYLLSEGFSQEEIKQAYDHRIVALARKAWLYDNNQTNNQAAKKKVAKIPKAMKPGAPKPVQQKNKEKLEVLRKKAQKSGKLDDAYAYMRAQREAS